METTRTMIELNCQWWWRQWLLAASPTNCARFAIDLGMENDCCYEKWERRDTKRQN
jgi:hypothetical protein